MTSIAPRTLAPLASLSLGRSAREQTQPTSAPAQTKSGWRDAWNRLTGRSTVEIPAGSDAARQIRAEHDIRATPIMFLR